jgi:hypothetical protein
MYHTLIRGRIIYRATLLRGRILLFHLRSPTNPFADPPDPPVILLGPISIPTNDEKDGTLIDMDTTVQDWQDIIPPLNLKLIDNSLTPQVLHVVLQLLKQ